MLRCRFDRALWSVAPQAIVHCKLLKALSIYSPVVILKSFRTKLDAVPGERLSLTCPFCSRTLRRQGHHSPENGAVQDIPLGVTTLLGSKGPAPTREITSGRKRVSVAPLLEILFFIEHLKKGLGPVPGVPQNVITSLRNRLLGATTTPGRIRNRSDPVFRAEHVVKHHRAPVNVDVPDLHEEATRLGQELTGERSGVANGIKIRVDATIVGVDERASGESVVPELRVEVHAVRGVKVDHLNRPAQMLVLEKRRHRPASVGMDQPVRPVTGMLVPLDAGRAGFPVLVERREHVGLPILGAQRVQPRRRVDLLRPHQHGGDCRFPVRSPIPLEAGLSWATVPGVLPVLTSFSPLLRGRLDGLNTRVVGPSRSMLVRARMAHRPTASWIPRSINAVMLLSGPT